MLVNYKAPVVVKLSLDIKAEPDIVWEMLANISNWPSWVREIETVDISGSVEPATPFVWKANGMKITSLVRVVDISKRLVWTGTVLGTRAVHTWDLAYKNGVTTLTSQESLEGLLPMMFRSYFKKNTEKFIKSWMAQLKNIILSQD